MNNSGGTAYTKLSRRFPDMEFICETGEVFTCNKICIADMPFFRKMVDSTPGYLRIKLPFSRKTIEHFVNFLYMEQRVDIRILPVVEYTGIDDIVPGLVAKCCLSTNNWKNLPELEYLISPENLSLLYSGNRGTHQSMLRKVFILSAVLETSKFDRFICNYRDKLSVLLVRIVYQSLVGKKDANFHSNELFVMSAERQCHKPLKFHEIDSEYAGRRFYISSIVDMNLVLLHLLGRPKLDKKDITELFKILG